MALTAPQIQTQIDNITADISTAQSDMSAAITQRDAWVDELAVQKAQLQDLEAWLSALNTAIQVWDASLETLTNS